MHVRVRLFFLRSCRQHLSQTLKAYASGCILRLRRPLSCFACSMATKAWRRQQGPACQLLHSSSNLPQAWQAQHVTSHLHGLEPEAFVSISSWCAGSQMKVCDRCFAGNAHGCMGLLHSRAPGCHSRNRQAPLQGRRRTGQHLSRPPPALPPAAAAPAAAQLLRRRAAARPPHPRAPAALPAAPPPPGLAAPAGRASAQPRRLPPVVRRRRRDQLTQGRGCQRTSPQEQRHGLCLRRAQARHRQRALLRGLMPDT